MTSLFIGIQVFYVFEWVILLFFNFYSLVARNNSVYITVHGEAYFVIKKINSFHN